MKRKGVLCMHQISYRTATTNDRITVQYCEDCQEMIGLYVDGVQCWRTHR